MEYVEGVGLILLGLLIIIFGGTPAVRAQPATRRFTWPAWLDNLLKWFIGALCVWFGASLLLGHSHFF
jgi:hypothetical protein